MSKRPDLSKRNKETGLYSKYGIETTGKDKRIYRIWSHLKDRCFCKTNKDYKKYGLRGITICNDWKDKQKGFINFYNWSINNGYKDNLTIDRINNNGNYEPNNCRWVTLLEQARNRRNNKNITYNNETHCISEWAEILNIPRKCLEHRLKKWSMEQAFTKPVRRRHV